jgi:hypothetical protein
LWSPEGDEITTSMSCFLLVKYQSETGVGGLTPHSWYGAVFAVVSVGDRLPAPREVIMSRTKLFLAVLCCSLGSALGAHAESALAPSIQISSVQVLEGNSGQTPFTAQVSVYGYYPTTPIALRVTATPGTADESDYIFETTELTFTGSGITQTVTGYVLGDTSPEGDEYFNLSATLVGSGPAYFVPGHATVTIKDDDQSLASQLHVEGASVMEGNQGTTSTEIRVRLEPASSNTVKVSYQTVDVTASAGSDYQSASGTFTFAPGEVLKTLSIPIIGDRVPEADERFAVVLSQPSMALLGTARAEVVIVNDDPVVHAAIADLSVDEGDLGVKVVPVIITFDQPVPDASKVQVSTLGGGAIADQDFRTFSQTLYPPAGATQMTFDLEVLSDTVPECDEGLYVRYATLYMGDDTPKLAKVILRNDDGLVNGCTDPFVSTSAPEPPTDAGPLLPPPVEPRPVDADGSGAMPEAGSPSATAPEPQAPNAGSGRGDRDTGAPPDLASTTTPTSTSDAQLVQTPASLSDSGSIKPGDERLAAHSGCSCALGLGGRSTWFPGIALMGLVAAAAVWQRRSRR